MKPLGVLHSAMVSSTSAVKSIRLQNDTWTQLAVEAEKRATTVNGLIADLVIVGLYRAAEAKAAAPVKPAVEKAGAPKAFRPHPKPGKR